MRFPAPACLSPRSCLRLARTTSPRHACAGGPNRSSLDSHRKRNINIASTEIPKEIAPFFTLWPSYFSKQEQRILLSAALQRLDSMDAVKTRRQRLKNRPPFRENDDDLEQLFAPDELYDFHQGHYDGVIHHYREMHLTSWPTDQISDLAPVLDRLYALCPTKDVQTHLLHLASHGDILPHVDNVAASGSWILGASLGDERILHMASVDDKSRIFETYLPSGSVYIQKDHIRYSYRHSIRSRPEADKFASQRLSIMIRVGPSSIFKVITILQHRLCGIVGFCAAICLQRTDIRHQFNTDRSGEHHPLAAFAFLLAGPHTPDLMSSDDQSCAGAEIPLSMRIFGVQWPP